MVRSAICCAFTDCSCAAVTTHGDLVLPHSVDGAGFLVAATAAAPSIRFKCLECGIDGCRAIHHSDGLCVAAHRAHAHLNLRILLEGSEHAA